MIVLKMRKETTLSNVDDKFSEWNDLVERYYNEESDLEINRIVTEESKAYDDRFYTPEGTYDIGFDAEYDWLVDSIGRIEGVIREVRNANS